MRAKLERGKAAFRMHASGYPSRFWPVATLSLSAPDRALAACGASSHPAGVHAAASGAGGSHAATSTVATSSGAAEAEASDARTDPAPRRRAACKLPLRVEYWSPACARRAPRPMRGPLQRGPRTPPRICAALDLRIAAEAPRKAASRQSFRRARRYPSCAGLWADHTQWAGYNALFNDARRVPRHQAIRRHVLHHNARRRDHAIVANCNARHDDAACANVTLLTNARIREKLARKVVR